MSLLKLFLLCAVIIAVSGNKPPVQVISCGPVPYTAKGTIYSVRSGNWNDPATWGGRVPSANDAPVISAGHIVVANIDASVAGIQIAGTLSFSPAKPVSIQSSKNLLVTGLLEMISFKPSIVHTIRFIHINENKFEGGGMDPVDSDVGLWVMGAGKLNLQGHAKTSFTNATGSIANGSTTITVKDAAGWQPGDEIMITPTAENANNFDVRTIKSIHGNTITLNTGATSHPMINGQWTAESGNLTRNIRIEGTGTGKSHIFIRSSVPQTIKDVAFRYLGPRKDQGETPATELIQGRYGLHFHHCMDGSTGSVVDGCVMRDIDNHAYVPHVSNGIVMSNNIAFNVTETPFWWDIPDPSHNIQWLHNLVALPKYIDRSIGMDTKGAPTFGVNGFILGFGDDNVCNDNVVAGQTGLETTNAAYDWEEMDIESEWTFKNNTAHNCNSGLRSWQNNTRIHVIENSTLYHNGIGIFHGAYVNMYRYVGGELYKSPVQIKAASGGSSRLRFENLHIDAAGLDYAVVLDEGPLNGPYPVLFRNCTITGARIAQVIDDNPGPGIKCADFVECQIAMPDFKISSRALNKEVLRVQPATGQSFQITGNGKTSIEPFAARSWGEGAGLKAEYYAGKFDSLLFTRTEPAVHLTEFTEVLFHHKLTNYRYSIRYTGDIMPQQNAEYTFYTEAGGGVRLWVNDQLIIDKWAERYPGLITSHTIKLTQGKRCRIKLEYFNEDDRSGINLFWSSAAHDREYIPQSQLYTN